MSSELFMGIKALASLSLRSTTIFYTIQFPKVTTKVKNVLCRSLHSNFHHGRPTFDSDPSAIWMYPSKTSKRKSYVRQLAALPALGS
jgi:hypothetical protein